MSDYGGSNWSGSLHPSQSLSQTKKRTHSGDKAAGGSGASGARASPTGSPESDGGHSGSGTSAGGRHHSGRSVASYDARPDRKDSGWMPFPNSGGPTQGEGDRQGQGQGQQAHTHGQAAPTASAPVRPPMQKTGASSPFTSQHVPNSFTLSFSGRRSSREGESTIGGVSSVPTSPNDGPIIRLAPPSEHGSSSHSGPAGPSSTSGARGPGPIPNFPGPGDIREPVRSPSPASSYASSSQFKAPSLPKPKPGGVGGRPSLGKLPSMTRSSFSSASGGPASPWHALAAASGAPTPSLDGPGRNSPMLGGPFEKLNLEGSWSGANLFGPPEAQGQGQASGPPGSSPLRRGSLPAQTNAPVTVPTARRPSATAVTGGVGMTADMLEKYRALAGRASATGSAGRHRGNSDVSGISGTGSGASGSGDGMDIDPPAPGSSISATSSRSNTSGGSGGMKLTLPSATARRRDGLPAGNSGLAPPSISRGHGAKMSSPLASSASASVSPSSAAGSVTGSASLSAAGSVQSGGAAGGSSGYLHMLVPNDAPPVLSAPGTLVLDIRPPSAYDATHIRNAHSVSVPSTLLRRPAFGLAKMAGMLSPSGKEAVDGWASMQNVVLIDGDSLSAGDGSILDGVARKFEKEGFGGTVWFVRGGQAALIGVPALKGKMVGNEQGGLGIPGQRQDSASPGPMAFSLGGSASSSRAPSFRSGQSAPMAATPSVNMRSNPFDNSREGSTTERPLSLRGLNFSDASSQVSGSSASSAARSGSQSNSGSGSRSGTGSGSSANRKGRSSHAANPFFDNIRQNLELSHGGITERITLQLPSEAKRRAHELPAWMSELVLLSDKAAADRLAHQFYTVELNEQKRLQAIMDHHSRESGAMLQATRIGDTVGDNGQWKDQRYKDKEEVNRLEGWAQGKWHEKGEEYYPFSITAGIERGAKNRYKNIWPYDFSRVRLNMPADDESDYINASYVQPRGTSRRYIATQGPLDATYRDFWTLIWEQDVRVIVMLTKQYEGGMIKCGNYWQDEHYGPFHVSLDSQTGGEDAAHPSQVSGFDFGMAQAADKPKSHGSSANHESVNIRREFILRNDDDQDAGSRRVVQIQCVNWPDFDVPESPDVLLGVIKDVDQAVDEVVPPNRRGSVGGKDGDRCEQSPVLVHCSAGVGRTGSFIVVDSIIDALHREFEAATLAGIEYDSAQPQSTTKIPSGIETATAHEDRASSFDSATTGQSESSGRYGSSKRNVSFSVPPPLKSAVPSEGATQGEARAQTTGTSSHTPIQSPSPRYHSRHNTAERLSSQADSRAARHSSSIVEEREEDDKMDIDETSNSTGTSAVSSAHFPSQAKSSQGGAPASPKQKARSYSQTNSKVPDPWSYRDTEGSVGDDQSEAGSSAGGVGSVGRRPSLVSLGGSDRNSQEQLPTIIEYPAPVTKSGERHRTPSPLRDMDHPVLDVLEGIRVQRMSLVQSLRQFVFVHRAIVAYYLGLLDDAAEHDRKSSKESSAETTDPRASSQPLTAEASDSTLATQSTQSTHSSFSSNSTDPTSVGISDASEDDGEGPHKRRASPTELSPERRLSDLAGVPKNVQPKAGALQRRGSNKRIKQDKKALMEGFEMSPSPGAPSIGGESNKGGGVGGSAAGSGVESGSSAFGSSF